MSSSPTNSNSSSPSRSPSPDFGGAWPESNYRPYPADTTIPLSLLPRDDVPEEKMEHATAVRKFKVSKKRRFSLCVDVLERRLEEDVEDYLDGRPLVADEVRETRKLIPKRKKRDIRIRPVWIERARELGEYFDQKEMENADRLADRLLLGGGDEGGSGARTEVPATPPETTAAEVVGEALPEKRKREDADEEEGDDGDETIVKRRRSVSPPRFLPRDVKIPGLFLLDG